MKYFIDYNEIITNIFFNNNKKLNNIKTILKNDNKLKIYEQENIYKNLYIYIKNKIKYVECLCKNLDYDFIKKSFITQDAIIIIGSKNQDILPNGNIYGIALISFDEKYNNIYIDLLSTHIGTKNVGNILLNELEYICRKLYIQNIKLRSIKKTILFYMKYNYKIKDIICNNDEILYEMEKNLNSYF
jgi:hypothetical protein